MPRSDKVASRERGADRTAILRGEIEADHNAAASAHEEDAAADRGVSCVGAVHVRGDSQANEVERAGKGAP